VSILAALEQVRPGGTVQFGAGTYLVGPLIRVDVPRITLAGHSTGTTLRGCDPSEYEKMEWAVEPAFAADPASAAAVVARCGMFELTGGHVTVRDITFENSRLGLVLGCCHGDRDATMTNGGYLIERNTFRNSGNGIRPGLLSAEPTIIRGNVFINAFHAISARGGHLHVLDNDISVPEPGRVPGVRHPSFAVAFSADHNRVVGNRIEGHPDGILVIADPGGTCRHNVIRDNTIVVRRVRFPASRPHPDMPRITDPADSTIAGVPLLLYSGTRDGADPGILEDNLIEGNRILGADGLAIEVVRAARTRIVGNSITGVMAREPFPGNTLGHGPGWRVANGAGMGVSPGSEENEIVGNTFENIASHAIVIEGDRNRVELRSGSDAVRDLGRGNVVVRGFGTTAVAPTIMRAADGAARPTREGYAPGADGVRLFFRFEGQGRDTVVVLHGGPSLGLAYLAPDLEPLSRDFTLPHYDQRGVGRSTLPPDGADLAVARHVADLDALRRHFGLGRLVLLGHSWGAMLAAHYAAAHPQRVERMLVVDPMAPAAAPFTAQVGACVRRLMEDRLDDVQRLRLDSVGPAWAGAEHPAHCRAVFGILARVYFQDPAGVDRARGDFCSGSADVLRSRPQVDEAIPGALGDWDVRPLLRVVDAPVLILHGAESAIPLNAMEAWADAFPNARLQSVPDAGHYLHVDRPDVFFAAAAEFLRGCRPADGSAAVASTSCSSTSATTASRAWTSALRDDRRGVRSPLA